jgi:hypothetical protein
MPRFYLNLQDHDELKDPEGVEAESVEAARAVAIRGARDIMAEDVRGGELNLSETINVVDEDAQIVSVVSFRDAVTILE